MGFDIFLLVLEPEQPVYIPGQAVQGYLKVVGQEEVACRNIKITIKGHSKVHWSEKSGKNRRHYRAEEQYFRQPVTVWDGANSNNAMQPCNRKFLFNFILPHDIPSSFISHIGRVIYQVKAEADRPWTLDQSHKVFFSVNFMYDLNTDHLARPIRLQDEKTVCCLCCSQGPIDLNMRCARSGYVPGESIVVDGEVVNHSGGNIMYTEIKLVQMIKYITTSKNRKEERTVQRVYHPQVDGGARDLWASVPLPIPAVPASHLKHCNIITIDYTFVVRDYNFSGYTFVARHYNFSDYTFVARYYNFSGYTFVARYYNFSDYTFVARYYNFSGYTFVARYYNFSDYTFVVRYYNFSSYTFVARHYNFSDYTFVARYYNFSGYTFVVRYYNFSGYTFVARYYNFSGYTFVARHYNFSHYTFVVRDYNFSHYTFVVRHYNFSHYTFVVRHYNFSTYTFVVRHYNFSGYTFVVRQYNFSHYTFVVRHYNFSHYTFVVRHYNFSGYTFVVRHYNFSHYTFVVRYYNFSGYTFVVRQYNFSHYTFVVRHYNFSHYTFVVRHYNFSHYTFVVRHYNFSDYTFVVRHYNFSDYTFVVRHYNFSHYTFVVRHYNFSGYTFVVRHYNFSGYTFVVRHYNFSGYTFVVRHYNFSDNTFVLMAKLGTCMKAKITAPIIIGSVPLRNTYSTFLPHPVRAGGTTLAPAIPSPASGRVSPYRPSAPAHPVPPVPAHAPYSLPPPSYNETFLPEEYSEVPPPSYASCVFGGARGDEAAEDSDDGGFAPRYITYRTNT
ncbi:Arrestin domain-containing protein 3 [Chionoecetes opilio]|uniref:Arrestin domain-containing protein 3 n=1 Tax=Chionoecetes opilio TaxID=41210 RepID=A0A8J4YIW3_CHIOP|nr:Arrestin domain-containing protein 3 [Chionoecetes opilio]